MDIPSLRTALVVEDEPEFSRLLAEAVQALGDGWQARCLRRGLDALAAIERAATPPALVLADLGLPDVGGIAVVAAARRAWATVPILVVSALTGSDSVLAAIRAGANGYVQKADSALSLALAIQRVLDGEYPISPALAQHLFDAVAGRAPSAAAEPPARLSARELELLRLLAQAYQYDEAAERMGVTLGTVRTFVQRIYGKLQVHSKVEAITAAREFGLL